MSERDEQDDEGDPDDLLLPDVLLAAAFAPLPAAARPRADPDGADVGARYRVDGELGRGGVGVVLRGRDLELGRDVALKVLRAEHADNVSLERRFVEEAQIAGQLEHPGIVPVYEMGRTGDRRPFFAMRLVQGRTLASLLAARATAMEEQPRFLAIFEQVCQTVAYAHARGVVHRDLKPANVMVGAFGEVQVADWGLAKVLGRSEAAETAGPAAPAELPASGSSTAQRAIATTRTSTSELLSQAGSVLGTLAYMPPEQARGEHDKLDARADVFALGAMLCELLTGRPPYVGEPADVLDAARAATLGPAFERLRASGADGELVALATRCLAAERDLRPRDAAEVAAAVARHRASLEERARAAELAATAAHARAAEERRARRLTLALAATLVVAVAAGAGGWLHSERASRSRQETAAKPVQEAMGKARDLAAEARHAPAGDPAAALVQWQAGLTEIARAESAKDAADPGPAVAAELATLAAELRAGADEAARRKAARERDAAMAMRLERIPQTWGIASWDVVDRDFEQAFADYGVDLATMTDAEILARIRASTISIDISSGLFAWLRTKYEMRSGRGPMPPDADRLLALAQASDPDPWRVRIRASVTLGGDGLDTIAADPAVDTFDVRTTLFLGFLLDAYQRRDKAVALFRKARERDPEIYIFWVQLGDWLRESVPVPWEEVTACYSAGVALEGRSPLAWQGLGVARDALCDYAGAFVAFDRAQELLPDFKPLQLDRSRTLLRVGRLEEAVALLRATIGAAPADAQEATLLAHALLETGDAAAAGALVAELANRTTSGVELLLLTPLLRDCGEPALAAAQARRILDHADPTSPPDLLARAAAEVARALLASGDVAGAVAEFGRAQKLLPRAAVEQELEDAKSLVEYAERVDELVSGAWLPDPPQEQLAAARTCGLGGHYVAAAELFESALAALAVPPAGSGALPVAARVQAAHAALLAASGRDVEAGTPDPATCAHLRELARTWLTAELRERVHDAPLQPRGLLREQLEAWRRDPAFAAMRRSAAGDAPAALPPKEAAAWRSFWSELQTALLHAPAR